MYGVKNMGLFSPMRRRNVKNIIFPFVFAYGALFGHFLAIVCSINIFVAMFWPRDSFVPKESVRSESIVVPKESPFS